jgi:hypothetical protein
MEYPASTLSGWPDPFSRLPAPESGHALAHMRLSRRQFVYRTPVADALIALLLSTALDPQPSPHQRCSLYTVIAALHICPDDVVLTALPYKDVPPFLRPFAPDDPRAEPPLTLDYLRQPSLRKATIGFCGTCGAVFDPPPVAVRVDFESLSLELAVDSVSKATVGDSTLHHPSLALLPGAQANNQFALWALQTFPTRPGDGHALLTLLAFGLDALKGLLDGEHVWRDDVRRAMADFLKAPHGSP